MIMEQQVQLRQQNILLLHMEIRVIREIKVILVRQDSKEQQVLMVSH